jgi:hypothetical protein
MSAITEASPRRPATARLVPLIGVAFTVLFIGSFLAGGDSAEPTTSGADVIAKYSQSDPAQLATGTAAMIAAITLVFFGAWLRSTLRDRSTSHAWLADVAFAGTVLQALTLSLFVASAHAVQDGIDSGQPLIAQALNIADGNNFFPSMLALACVLIATGASSLSAGLLPKWLAVISIVLGVMAPLGKAGFAPFMLFPIWVTVVGLLGSRQPSTSSTDAVTVRPITQGA